MQAVIESELRHKTDLLFVCVCLFVARYFSLFLSFRKAAKNISKYVDHAGLHDVTVV